MTKIWGYTLWMFFHTITEKIKDDSFEKHKTFMINIIESLCNTIPCDECEKDARQYIKRNPLNRVKTKSDLKLYLFDFHNYVNKKTNKPQYLLKDLEFYNTVQFSQVITFFKKYYLHYRGSGLDLTKGLHRRITITHMFKHMAKHLEDFDD